MTNEQAKQETIKNAYGEYWETVKEFVLIPNGSCLTSFWMPGGTEIFDFRKLKKSERDNFRFVGQNDFVIPKSIDGIHYNNGWTRIEPDGSNLPKLGKYKWILGSGLIYEETFDPKNATHVKEFLYAYTHYKPITPELKPIY